MDAWDALFRYLKSGNLKALRKAIINIYRQDESGRDTVYGMLEPLLAIRDWDAIQVCLDIAPGLVGPSAPFDGPLHGVLMEIGDAPDLMAWLVKRGAEIHRRGSCHWTPLHRAAAAGHVGSASVLLDCGADIEMGTKIDGDYTPLMSAAAAGKHWCAMLLARRGANLHRGDSIWGEMLSKLHVKRGMVVLSKFLRSFPSDEMPMRRVHSDRTTRLTEPCHPQNRWKHALARP